MADDGPALYRREGDRFLPTRLTEGPWAPGTQAGAATAALLAWAVEQVPTLAPLRTVRYTFDLLRPAPVQELTVRTHVLREGKRIQVVETSLHADEVAVACCRALRMRRGTASPPVAENPDLAPLPAPPPPGELRWSEATSRDGLPGIMSAYEVRSAAGDDPGWSTTMWLRLLAAVVEGTPTPPVVALAAASDFVSNSANHADPTAWSMINADISLDVVREPTSDWLAMVVRTSFATDGIGHSVARIHDETDVVASAMTMGIVEPRGPRPS